MNAPPGVDSESSDEDISPTTSPSVSPTRAKFSLKSLFAPKLDTTPPPAEKEDEIDSEPPSTNKLQKLKRRVRILAGGDNHPTSNIGEAVHDVPDTNAPESGTLLPTGQNEDKDPAAEEMLSLLRRLVAKQQMKPDTPPVVSPALASPMLTPSKLAKSSDKVSPKLKRPPLIDTSPLSSPPNPNLSTPNATPGLNDTYFHPDHQDQPPPRQPEPSTGPDQHGTYAGSSPQQQPPWSAPWQTWQPPHSHTPRPNMNYPPPMYPHPHALQPWYPGNPAQYQPPPWYGHYPHYPPPLQTAPLPPQPNHAQYSPYSDYGNSDSQSQGASWPSHPRFHYYSGQNPSQSHWRDKTTQQSPGSPLANPWNTTPPPTRREMPDASTQRTTRDPEPLAKRTAKDVLHSKTSAERTNNSSTDKPRVGKATKSDPSADTERAGLEPPKPTPDPFAGMLTTHAPDGHTSSYETSVQPDWGKALVSFAICIDLVYTAFRHTASASPEEGNSQLVMRLVLGLCKILGGGKSIADAWESALGTRSSGESFAKELDVVAAFVAHSKLFAGDGGKHQIIQLLWFNSQVQEMLKDWPLAAYITPGNICIVKDVATKWKDGDLSLKVVLRSIMAMRKELNHPTQKAHVGLLDQLAVLFSKQLKHQSATPVHIIPPAGRRTRTTTPRHPPPPHHASTVADDSSESAYSASEPGTPGTLESDEEAEKMLAMADSGPSIARVTDHERSDRPGRKQVQAAKEVLKP